ncbi:MAG TPA: sigma factor, partial [Tepidisphaeraceae bacterium]|nr:sigma factor [Tepidisphaeraceae bacterium]
MGRSENDLDDYALMRGIAARDQTSLRTLYDRYAALVYTLVVRILRDRADADELLTDVFWEIWVQGNRFDESRGCPRSYLVTLARSRAIDRLRSRGRHATVMQISQSPAAAQKDSAETSESA